MKPKDIHRLYQKERAATDEEAAEGERRVRADPQEARRLIATLLALADEDPDPSFKHLRGLFIGAAVKELVVRQVAADDTFALACGAILLQLMHATMRPPRGRKTSAA